jgi:thioredoxin reductase (NADPH)
MNKYDVIIVGAGPAGLTAAIYVQRAGYRSLVLEEFSYGGQMANTPEVVNYPAIGKISGAELGLNLYNQAIEHGTQVEFDGVASVQLLDSIKTVATNSGKVYSAKAIILANGAKRRQLGVKGETEFAGRGVSYCATCDGGFFKEKITAVVGGGNVAVEDALYLANLCPAVHLIHRRDTLRAGKMLVEDLKKYGNIAVHYNTIVQEILPDTSGKLVGGILVKNVETGSQETIPVQGVFAAVGLRPDNEVFKGQITLDPAGYIVAGEDTKTNVAGVFAAGDTRTKSLRQIVTAAGDGAVAASEAGNYLLAFNQ